MTDHALSVIVHRGTTQSALSSTLDSILSQTLSAVEVLVVLDAGSPIEVAEAVRGYAPRVNVAKSRRRGPGSLNAAFQQSTAPYVAFVAAGAVWPRNYASDQLHVLEQQPAVGVLAGGRQVMDSQPNRPITLRRLIDESPLLDLSATVMRRSVVQAAGMFDEGVRYGYDMDLWLRLALRGETIVAGNGQPLTAASPRRAAGQDDVEATESLISVLERFVSAICWTRRPPRLARTDRRPREATAGRRSTWCGRGSRRAETARIPARYALTSRCSRRPDGGAESPTRSSARTARTPRPCPSRDIGAPRSTPSSRWRTSTRPIGVSRRPRFVSSP